MGRNNLIQIRKGSDWSSDPVLASGEPGFDIPNNILKIGDGVKTWSELIPIGSGSSVSGGLYNIVEDTTPQLGGNLDLNNYNIVGTGNVSVSGNITANSGTLDVLSFNINNASILTKGQLSWDDTEGTLDIGLTDNTIIHIGEHRYFRIRNQTGSPLYKGQVVYASGVHANGIIEPALYVADGTVREVRFMGVILEDVNHQNNGYAIDFGHLEEMDLDGSATNYAVGDETWSDGDILYVHPTVAGKLTKNEPKHSISVAIILDVGNGNGNGRMFVRPTSYGHLDDHHDVAVSGATNGQFLQYNSATDYWVPSSSGNFTTLQVNGTAVPTGVGTTNYVTKWTGTNGLGAGIIYDNGNNIGIGTSFPLAKLHIINPNTFQNPNVIIHDSSDLVAGVGASIILGGKFNTAGSYGDFAEIKSIKESSANNDASASLAFFTTNIADLNERMRITSSGSVGIGVSTPLARLHVDGNGIFASGLNISNQTASTIASFDSNKNIVSLPTSTYPSLTELSHIKGLTSNAQTQINGKVTSNTSITGATKTKITYDSKGLVTTGSDLTESDIPSLSQSKITNLVTDLSDRTTKTYISSRGENLLTNGTALLGNNTNFSSFTFDGANANSSPGSFRFIGPGTVYTDEFMPVLAEKRYKMSVDAKTLNGVGRYYMMTVAFDVDNQVISANHHMYRANTLTTLASELKNGDTVVYLTSAANWDNSGTAGVSTHLRSIILWNYTNSFGYTYPPLTYSRNWFGNAWDPGSIDFVNNTITLRVPWAGGTVPAGTQLSNGSSGGSFKYNILANTLLTTSWTTYTGFMDGIDYSGANVTTKFPPGTAKIKLGWLMNYAGTGETAWFTNMTVGLDDNAYTATTLQISRNINGTSFNGSADITTSSWGTARNITIGNTTRSVNGSTNYSWTLSDIGAQATLTNPITGTGTSNFLPKWSTSGSLTNSAISENQDYILLSKPMFIGTNPNDFLGEFWVFPTGYLYVNPIGVYTNRFLADTDETVLTQLANRTVYNTAQTPAYSFLTNNDVGMYLPDNSGHLAFSTSGTERLRILSNGNIGIGIAVPSGRLHVEGGNIIFNDLGGDYDFRVEGDNDSNLLFTDASTDRIGIGTNAPASKLHVNGEIRASGNLVPATDNTGAVGTAALTWNNGQFTNLTVDSTLNVLGAIDLADNDILRLGTGDDWEFFHNGTHNYIDLTVGDIFIRNDAAAGDPVIMTIQRSGNIGIGTDSPTEKLTVDSGNIIFNESGGNFDFRVEGDTDSNLLFTDASTDRVGVGTSSPVQKLQVHTSQLEIAGFHYSPLMGPIGAKQLQSLIVESRGNSVILKHLENPFAGSTMELQNLIRYGSDFISIDAAYSGVLGITYYPKLKVNTSTGATTFNDAYTLPTADGSSGQALVTDGNGNVSWEDVSSGSSSSNLTRGSFALTQTSGTFVVDGGYNVGTLDVYYNGSKLLTGTDYSATNGSSFTLTNPAASGDIVEYLALNAQTSAVGNTVLGSVSVTSSQSVFDVQNGYTAGGLAVFLNGIKLIDTIDFSATNGTSFTLTSPASSGDIVDYIAYGAVVASTNLQKTGDTMTGNLTIGNGSDLIVEGDFILSSYKEGFVDFGNTGSTKTIDISSGTIQTCVLTANCVFTMPNPEAGRSFTLLLKTGTGNFTSTFTNVKWSNDSSPTITTASNKIDILTFVSDGVNWYGTITQNYST